jgi:hypothetical protein
MAPQNQQQQEPAAAAVRLPDFYSDLPQSWFQCLDAMFATTTITQPIMKFHWSLAKLPFSLIATVRPLSRETTAVSDPYKELLLRSYSLSAEQMTSKWLDYPMCGNTRPSVMWDNLTALQPAMVKEAQTVLFLRKLPRHIRNLINPRAFKEPAELILRTNKLRETQTEEEAAAAAAATRPQFPFRGACRSLSPFRRKGSGSDKSGPVASPPRGRPEAAATIACVLPLPLRKQGPEVREGLLLPGKLIGRQPALTAPPLFSTGISHSYVYLTLPAAFKLGAAHRSAPRGG